MYSWMPKSGTQRNVACVGGSWIVPTDAIQAGDWGRIEQLARDASQLAR